MSTGLRFMGKDPDGNAKAINTNAEGDMKVELAGLNETYIFADNVALASLTNARYWPGQTTATSGTPAKLKNGLKKLIVTNNANYSCAVGLRTKVDGTSNIVPGAKTVDYSLGDVAAGETKIFDIPAEAQGWQYYNVSTQFGTAPTGNISIYGIMGSNENRVVLAEGNAPVESKVVFSDRKYVPIPVNEIQTQIAFMKDSVSYGGRIYAIAQDSDYLYIGGATNRKVWKILKKDMSFVAESAQYPAIIRRIVVDGNSIYVGGDAASGEAKVWKLNKTTLELEAESDNYAGAIRAMYVHGDYLYIGGSENRKVWKLSKSDLTKDSVESVQLSHTIRSLYVDDSNVFCGLGDGGELTKLNIADLSIAATTNIITNHMVDIVGNGNYIYVCSITTKKVFKLLKSDLSLDAESAEYGTDVQGIFAQGDYIFVVGNSGKVQKLDKDTLVLVAQSSNFGGTLYTGIDDGIYFYVGVAEPYTLVKKCLHVMYRDICWQVID